MDGIVKTLSRRERRPGWWSLAGISAFTGLGQAWRVVSWTLKYQQPELFTAWFAAPSLALALTILFNLVATRTPDGPLAGSRRVRSILSILIFAVTTAVLMFAALIAVPRLE